MHFPRTISLYVAREVLMYSLLGLVAVSFVFVGHNLVRRLADFLMVGVDPADILVIVRSVLLVTLAYTVPIAFLFGALVGMARLCADAEITAMRTCGIGLRDLVLPVFALGVLVSGLTWYISLDVEHRAKRAIRDAVLSMSASGEMIRPGRFKQLGERMFYVEGRDRENRLERVFIADNSDPRRPLLIFAESGAFQFDPKTGRIRVELRNGSLHVDGDEDGGTYHMAFDAFEYAFEVELPRSLDFRLARPRDMTMAELRDVVARARAGESIEHLFEGRVERYEVQIHRRYALPVAPMLFALIAVPISLRPVRGARAFGALLCGLVVALYYGILSFSQYLAGEAVVPAGLALWIPNAVFALLAAGLLWRARRLEI